MPKGREGAGGALTRAILGGLPPGVELDEREQALLAMASRQADDKAAFEADIADRAMRSTVGLIQPSPRRGRDGRRGAGCCPASTCPSHSRSRRCGRRRPRTRAAENRRPRDAMLRPIALDANRLSRC
jgi:hypothetical protein